MGDQELLERSDTLDTSVGGQDVDLRQLGTYREHLPELKKRLAEDGFLALLLIDVSGISEVERKYGNQVYDGLMQGVKDVVGELKGRQLRAKDIVALNERSGDVFLIFLAPRKDDEHLLADDIEKIGERVESFLSRRITQPAYTLLSKRPEIYVGTSLVLHNPLIREERLVMRAIAEAHEAAGLAHRRRQLRKKKELQRIILKEQLSTVFQPIVDLTSGKPHGFEALCRGPKETDLHSPAALFDIAEKADLLFELDHLCRRSAITSASKLSREYKLFINTLPFSMRDPSFQGKYLIELFDETELAPEQIVLEVTERLVIENYNLFIDAMKYFSDMRCLIAVDDVGAGYSGLETIAQLRPNYLKLDMSLVRDIDTSFVKRQVVQSFKSMAHEIDARLIAEGIESEKELEVMREIGVTLIQGHLLAKPSAAFQTNTDFPIPA